VSATVRVLVVDDDALVRSALRFLLGGDDGIDVVGEAADGEEVPNLVAALHPDVVLMDVRMPRVDGVTATSRLRARPDAPQVIVLTTFDADPHIVAALQAGAGGFLLKDTPPADLIAAIHRVAAGQPALSPSVARRLMDRVARAAADDDGRRAAARSRLAALSDREREVAGAIGRGLTNVEIGRQLFMSVATAKAHVTHILTKLYVDNRVQIALLVAEAGS
jgi:DNA-binding NarL/FixJ family response regulator